MSDTTEWGYADPSPQSWIDVTADEAGRDELPITLVATDHQDHVLGAVALGQSDDELTADERDGRSPWLLGLAVSKDDRQRGIGRLLVTALERLAEQRGQMRVWVATGGEAVVFYRRCGWRDAQQLRVASTGIATTVLNRDRRH
jgi:GNAT superfamily N-acetyltransferase